MGSTHKKSSVYVVAFLMLLCIGCGTEMVEELNHQSQDCLEEVEIKEVEKEDSYEVLKDLINSMSVEEKAGQVLMLAFRKDAFGNPILNTTEDLLSVLHQIKPGGVILFSENIQKEEQINDFINELQETSIISLLIAVDEEGGRVSRLTGKGIGFPELPGNRVLGENADAQEVRESGNLLGKHLRELGFNMNMAPVADVDSNPENPVIGDRSFGSDPELVGMFAWEQAEGMMEEGIIPVFKHFPGHGDTSEDSHFEQVILPHSSERMEQVELVPFQKAIKEGIPAIMTAHLIVPAYDEIFPATLSESILTGLLREKMGYKGVIVTDALEMAAISKEWGSGEAAVKALNAGADLLLMPPEPLDAHEAIVEAVKDGRLSESKLDESVSRILLLKKEYQLTIRKEEINQE